MKTTFSDRSMQRASAKGYSLIEFMVAMAVFMVVTGSVFGLFRKDDPLFNQQQSVSGLNLALQNSITQLQMDAVNAGSGYYAGTNIPNFPVGITISENMVAGVVTAPAVGDCGDNATYLYHADCFDVLNIIRTDPATLPQHPVDGTDTSTGSMVLSTPTVTTNAQAVALAALYHANDVLLIVTSNGAQMTTVKLNATTPTSVTGAIVTLNFTAPSGTGNPPAGVNPQDSLLLTTHSGGTTDNVNSQLTNAFVSGDWVLKLQPIVYSVDDTDPSNPKLTRKVGTNAPDVIAEQIVGFKVGASLANKFDTLDTVYKYDASQFGAPPGFDFSVIRAIRVSVIGRTAPNATSTNAFRNTYDSGPYQIQGLSVVINPRNLSMTDN